MPFLGVPKRAEKKTVARLENSCDDHLNSSMAHLSISSCILVHPTKRDFNHRPRCSWHWVYQMKEHVARQGTITMAINDSWHITYIPLITYIVLIPIGSMYAIYGNIYHPYTPNVSIYTIHGSYGLTYLGCLGVSLYIHCILLLYLCCYGSRKQACIAVVFWLLRL